jgi:hypothetical protein
MAKTGEEILSLQRVVVEAGTRYMLAVDPRKASPFERGSLVLDEITATLDWLFEMASRTRATRGSPSSDRPTG